MLFTCDLLEEHQTLPFALETKHDVCHFTSGNVRLEISSNGNLVDERQQVLKDKMVK